MFINAEKIVEAFNENTTRILLNSGNKQDKQKLSNCEVELERFLQHAQYFFLGIIKK